MRARSRAHECTEAVEELRTACEQLRHHEGELEAQGATLQEQLERALHELEDARRRREESEGLRAAEREALSMELRATREALAGEVEELRQKHGMLVAKQALDATRLDIV